VRICTLDLDKTFTADGLVAASGLVEVRRVGEEANGAFGGIFVEKDFQGLAIYERIRRQVDLSGSQVG
jgi:hypothetical protein